MSYFDLELAMTWAPICEFFETDGGKTEEEIAEAERMLGITFSKQCRDFYRLFGYMSFYGCEVYGIDPNCDSDILVGNSVAYALNDRKEYGLPKDWVPFYEMDDGYMAYLDYSSLNAEGEPCVISAFYNGKNFEVEEKLAEDFGEFLLQLVQMGMEADPE